MTGVHDHEMRVASGALEKESARWDREAPQLDTLAASLRGLALTRVEAGLFQVMFGAYEACRSSVEARAREGGREFRAMASTLSQLATAYHDLDAERAESIADLW